MMFKRYDVRDVIVNAVFDNNFLYSPKDKTGQQLQADHSKLDAISKEEIFSPAGGTSVSSSRGRSGGRVNFLPAGFTLAIPRLQRSDSCTVQRSNGSFSFKCAGRERSPQTSPQMKATKGGPACSHREESCREGDSKDSAPPAFVVRRPSSLKKEEEGGDPRPLRSSTDRSVAAGSSKAKADKPLSLPWFYPARGRDAGELAV